MMQTLYYITVATYAALAVSQAIRPGWRYRYFCAAALVLEAAYIAMRWKASGHPPMFGTFEETLMGAFSVTLAGVLFDRNGVFSRFTAPFAFIMLVYGTFFDTTPMPLIISEQSLWVDVHAFFAWAAYGFYAIVFAAAARHLIVKKQGDTGIDKLTDWAMHDGLLYGFIFQTVYFAAGSYYSTRLNGSWWMWDMVEYLFVASWFSYSIAMHGRIFFGWGTRRVALWVVGGFIITMALYWALIYIPWGTYHIFDPAIKMHYM